MDTIEQNLDELKAEVIRDFEKKTRLKGVNTELKSGGMGVPTLVFYVAYPTERHYRVLNEIKDRYKTELEEVLRATIVRSKKNDHHTESERQLFQKVLSESLITGRYSFKDDFFARYIKTASGAEEQISSATNHIVYGRRGSGKSTLLLYALHTNEKEGRFSAWVDLQIYSKRKDEDVIADVLCEILDQFSEYIDNEQRRNLLKILKSPGISLEIIRRQLPSIKNCLIPKLNGSFIFLDDFHRVEKHLQPLLLDALYSIIRGSLVNVKISAIETLSTTYNARTREGMQIGHDIQSISLDCNLAKLDQTYEHIVSILDANAQYCGLGSAKNLCTNENVLKRLVWSAAGVPRDAISIFSEALSKSQDSRISVSDINTAELNLLNSKRRDIEDDASESSGELNSLIERIRDFCFQNQTNAFLVRKDKNQESIMRLVDLRLLHVIHEPFTPDKAGEHCMALILDYGFYVSERKSSRIKPFNPDLEKNKTKELRKLPKFSVE